MEIALVGGVLVVLALVAGAWFLSRPSRQAAAGATTVTRRPATPPSRPIPPAPAPVRPERPATAPARTAAPPAVRTPATSRAPVAPPMSAAGSAAEPLVLIIDDSPVMRRTLAALFGKAGYRTAIAVDGEAAVAWIRANGVPSLVTLDMEMPGMDGRQTLDALHALAGPRPLRAVFVTNKMQSEQVRASATQKGAIGFFSKPFDPAELIALAGRVAPVAPSRVAAEPVLS